MAVKALKIGIVVFIAIPDGGAVAHRVLMMARGLVSLGHQVHIMVPYRFSPGPLAEEINGVQVHWGATIGRQAATTAVATLRKRLLLYKTCREVLTAGLDWLILYDMGLDGLPFVHLAKKYGCRLAADNCDIRTLPEKPGVRALFYHISYKLGNFLVMPQLQLNFAITHYLEKLLGKMAPGVPRIIVPAPVDLETFAPERARPEAFRERFGLKDDLVIGYMGSQYGVKGLYILLRAASRLREEGKRFNLLITGNAARNADLLRLLETLHLKDKAVLTGFLTQEELITAMAAADILVEPKAAHEQNLAAFPQKLAEYLAMGKPIVASAIGDIPLYLRDHDNALLYPAGDVEALARALSILLEDEGLRQRLSRRARETAVQYFDCVKIARRIEKAILAISKNGPILGELI